MKMHNKKAEVVYHLLAVAVAVCVGCAVTAALISDPFAMIGWVYGAGMSIAMRKAIYLLELEEGCEKESTETH